MSKKYAVVYPAFTSGGDGCGDLPSLVIIPFHYFAYERVCGYSLGHQAVFFDDLEQAKRFLIQNSIDSKHRSAIIEIDGSEHELTHITNIHLPKPRGSMDDILNRAGFFMQSKNKQLDCRPVRSEEMTEHALDELNRQYQSSLRAKMS